MNATEDTLPLSPPAFEARPGADRTGSELKRGALVNTVAMLTANFRSIFTFLVARLLGPATLGVFSVAWATMDLLSKFGILGLDDGVTTFIARAEATGNRAQARMYFRLATGLGLVQSVALTIGLVIALQLLGPRLPWPPEMVTALSVALAALPGIALYRIGTSASRGMKVMRHDIYSRGITDSLVTTLIFVIALAVGLRAQAPLIAAISGSFAAALVAVVLAARLFQDTPDADRTVSRWMEARRLLGYSAPISAYQFLNAFILRLDLIMLAWFIGRAPGVTLTTVGIYSAVVDMASGARKVNQAFYPIFAPVVAGMTATGEHARAAATYGRLAQWMLWILLPIVAVMTLAGGTLLLIYGSAFSQGSAWLGIVAVACATNAFIGLGETVIMVQRPRLNLLHSCITCVTALGVNLWSIPRFGVTGAAFGILVPYLVQGFLRYTALRFVFRWPSSRSDILPPLRAALIALVPALPCRFLLSGILGQVVSAVAFLLLFGFCWLYHSRKNRSPL